MPGPKHDVLLAHTMRSRKLQEGVDNGIAADTDEHEGFFKRGRDFEAVGDAHTYTEQEKKTLESFESLEYLPPNNAIYRDYIGDPDQHRPSQTSRWVAMGLIGLSVGFVGFLLKSTIDRISDWRYKLLFGDCQGDPTAPNLYLCGAITDVPDPLPDAVRRAQSRRMAPRPAMRRCCPRRARRAAHNGRRCHRQPRLRHRDGGAASAGLLPAARAAAGRGGRGDGRVHRSRGVAAYDVGRQV